MPRVTRNTRGNQSGGSSGDTNALHQVRPPGGHRCEQEARHDIGVDSDCQKVIDGAEYNGVCTRTKENERVIKTNTLHQDTGPGGYRDELNDLGGVGANPNCKSDGDGCRYDGGRGEMDNTTIDMHCESK